MDSFFTRFKNPLLLVFVLLAQTIGLAIQVRRPVSSAEFRSSAPNQPDALPADPASISLVRYWVSSTATPFERFFLGIGHNVRSGWFNYIDLRHTRQRDADLQHQLGDMRLQEAALAQDALQGHRLQALLGFQQRYIAHTVAAQVIGTSGSEFSRLVYIDKGREDGLKPDQAVITPDGIVGKLREVFPHTAQVLLIDDQTSGAGVLLSSTRIRAILRGTSTGRLVINNLTNDDRIKSGETILTSGGDQVYPRGLPVGTIQSIAPDPDHQPYTTIQVRSAANLSQLEEVLIITGTQPGLPPQASKDLAVGVATAEAQQAAAAHAAELKAAELKAAEDAKSAAQIVADRLPNLHDPNDPDSTPPIAKPGDPAAPIGGKMPHPPPTLRPDRYTPGSTPSAGDLTPGSPRGASDSVLPSSTPAPPVVTPGASVPGVRAPESRKTAVPPPQPIPRRPSQPPATPTKPPPNE